MSTLPLMHSAEKDAAKESANIKSSKPPQVRVNRAGVYVCDKITAPDSFGQNNRNIIIEL